MMTPEQEERFPAYVQMEKCSTSRLREMRGWCLEEFGQYDLGWMDFSIPTLGAYFIHFFCFPTEADAIFFKLRWSGQLC